MTSIIFNKILFSENYNAMDENENPYILTVYRTHFELSFNANNDILNMNWVHTGSPNYEIRLSAIHEPNATYSVSNTNVWIPANSSPIIWEITGFDKIRSNINTPEETLNSLHLLIQGRSVETQNIVFDSVLYVNNENN